MARVNSNCSPIMLVWAREKAGYSLEAAALALRIPIGTLEEWEIGITLPSYAQLEKIADKYKRPTMVFYLEEPPSEFQIIKDLRTTAAKRLSGEFEFSPMAIYALRIGMEKQRWARELLEEGDHVPIQIVESITINEPVVSVARKIREFLGVALEAQIECDSADAAYSLWKQSIEHNGIAVIQFPKVSIDEMRGFAISDQFAPLIAINAKDRPHARNFSLIHELTHILLGISGVSDIAHKSELEVERFCEAVAAETLMPREDFVRLIPTDVSDRPEFHAAKLARRYWCSKSAVLYRFVDLGRLSSSVVYEIVRRYKTLDEEQVEKEGKPIPAARIAIARNGKYFSQLAVGAFLNGEIQGGKLAELLGMKLHHLPKLEEMLGNH